MKRLLLAIVLSLALIGLMPQPAEGAERPRLAAVRAEGPLRLDGALDEQDWERAPPAGPFALILVREGESPSESTDVRVLITDTHVWFGIRCANAGPGPVRASLSPRDQILDDDHVAIHLDTYRDFRRAYVFGVNARGVQLDGILVGDEPDFSWDAVWDSEARLGPGGWTAEIAVPLRALRFPGRGPGVWGLWVRRQITKNDEVCSWPVYRLGVAGDIMLQAADLEGVEGAQGGGGYQVQPYVASARAESRPGLFTGVGEGWSGETRHDVGLDLRYGLTSTLTANVTANPDYSQVEADALQSDVNQRFPLFYAEKRPFFLEGAEVFNLPYQLVYTRRMADPAYGGKLIGKLGRWRVGAISVRDDAGGSTEGIGARSGDAPAAPGYFNVGRATYDIGENSAIGVAITDHVTGDPAGPAAAVIGLRAPGATRNTVASLDGKLRLARSLFFSGQLAASRTRLDTLVSGGPREETRFSDYLGRGALTWNDGTRYAEAYQDYLGADFRTDAGFLERIDVRKSGYEATYTFRPENTWLRFVEPRTEGQVIADTRGTLQDRSFSGEIEWGFQKQTFVEIGYGRAEERWLSTVYGRGRYVLEASNSYWRPLSFGFELAFEDGIYYADSDSASYLGWLESGSWYATARPSPRLTSELSATRSRFTRSRRGAEVYDIWLLGAKTTYQFTRRLYVRVYPQYDTYSEHLDADALVGYVLHPGSVLYLGVTGDFDKLGDRRRATQRGVFFKASYAFQG